MEVIRRRILLTTIFRRGAKAGVASCGNGTLRPSVRPVERKVTIQWVWNTTWSEISSPGAKYEVKLQ